MSGKGLFLAKVSSDYVAAAELHERNIDHFLVHRYWREKINNKPRICSELRLRGHLFFMLTVGDGWPGIIRQTTEEAGVVSKCRGVDHIFGGSNPQRVKSSVIAYLRGAEIAELKDSQNGRTKQEPAFGCGDLVKIAQHPLWEGVEGRVLANLRGEVHIALDNMTVEVLESDLKLVRKAKRAA